MAPYDWSPVRVRLPRVGKIALTLSIYDVRQPSVLRFLEPPAMPTIWGYVETVNNSPEEPPGIVVRIPMAMHRHCQVCARVRASTVIARGGERASLEDIRKGEEVELTYNPGKDGMEVVGIRLRSYEGS